MSTTTDTRQSLPLGTWALDPVHSTIGFEVNYLAGTFRGQFRDVITIKGVEKAVQLTGTITGPITDAYGRERIVLKLETTIDRTEFGLNWNVPLPDGKPALANEVKLAAELYFVKEA